FNHAFLNLLSNEVVSNVNVLGPGVLDIIAAKSNGTAIVIIQGNLIEDKAVVCCLCHGGVFRILKTPVNGSFEIPNDPFKCFKVLFEEIVTEYHTTLEEPALIYTKPSLDDKHVLDGLDQ
nr:hypothetical protein [Tanacetum cinerariifolium]